MLYNVKIIPILNVDGDEVISYSVEIQNGKWNTEFMSSNKAEAKAKINKMIVEHEVFCEEELTITTRNGQIVSTNYS